MLSDAQLMSSSPSRFPSSPSPSTGRYLPLSSSPLAPTKSSSPFARNQARRRSQYQSRVANTPKIGRPAFSPYTASSGSVIHGFSFAEDPQKAFLRERFKAQCFQRAVDARERVVRGRRWKKGEPSSDGLEMECEGMDEEGDEDVMQDELFKRIIDQANRKQEHLYQLSYQYEVGSSFDPNIEDVESWENYLQAPAKKYWPQAPPENQLEPQDLDEEELAAYAEEYAEIAALEDAADEIFTLSDLEDDDDCFSQSPATSKPDLDVVMVPANRPGGSSH